LRSKQLDVALLGLTGSAASRLGGQTLHSWAGIGVGFGTIPLIMRRIRRKEGALDNLKRVDVVILDE